MPKVSVLMPVYNGQQYLKQAIDSVLLQTFSDFELVLVDDGSTDKSAEIISNYRDKRIQYVANALNMGLASARNRAIEVSNGEYLAWLDSDDISLPNRLRDQVKFLDNHPAIALCGTWVRTIGMHANQVWKYSSDPSTVRACMLFIDPIATSAAMVRRECLEDEDLWFDLRYSTAEDYDMWERISRNNGVCNIPKVLTLYRLHSKQTSKKSLDLQMASVWSIQARLLKQLNLEPSEEQKTLHLGLGVGCNYAPDKYRLDLTEDWLYKLAKANDSSLIFPQSSFCKLLAHQWFAANYAVVCAGNEDWRRYGKSLLSKWNKQSMRRKARLLLSSTLHHIRSIYS